jgi:diguanylate cyclase (GGDEF)-like protein/PAS domain S-box-containing protein
MQHIKFAVVRLLAPLLLACVILAVVVEWLVLPYVEQSLIREHDEQLSSLMVRYIDQLHKTAEGVPLDELLTESALNPALDMAVERRTNDGSSDTYSSLSDDYHLVIIPIEDTPFQLSSPVYREPILKKARHYVWIVEGAVVGTLLIFGLLGVVVFQRLVLKPMSSTFSLLRESLGHQRQQLEEQNNLYRAVESRLEESQEIARLGCWEWDATTRQFWCSRSLMDVLRPQVPEPETLDQFFYHVHPADRYELNKRFEGILTVGGRLDLNFRVMSEDESPRHIHLVAQAFRENQKIIKVTGTCQDFSYRKKIESSLQQLSSAITYSGSSVIIIDVIGAIEYVNPKYTESTGYTLDELKGTQPDLLSRKWISADRYEALWQCVLSGQHWRGELQSRCKNGEMFWSLVSISPIHNEYKELTHFVIVCEDVSELKDAHAQMERLALYDELTGLPNRRFFFRQLSELIDVANPEDPAVVMLLDLDYFKTINDTQGHNVGDQLLIQVAQRLVDTLHDDDVAARLGGDEFAIIVHPIKDTNHIDKVARKILNAIAQPFLINGLELQISTSLGMACLPKDGNSSETLLKHADLAMYQAKEMGRNQYRSFTESLHDQLQTYLQFSREMPKALEADHFCLLYQPQVDLSTGLIVSVEALIRWEHPELGIVSPNEFIPVAEETGFIVTLGRWVFATACEMIHRLNSHTETPIRIAINLSSRQFRDPGLLDMVRDIIEEYQVDPGWIEVEITESLLMQDISSAIETLTELQALGLTIAIDDFGIGYSSFNYLKTLPINVLKVDREFIKDIPDHQDDMEITAAIISMAHRLNLTVVAEGIETDVQRRFLEEQRCNVGQGYLFSRPVTYENLVSLLEVPGATQESAKGSIIPVIKES